MSTMDTYLQVAEAQGAPGKVLIELTARCPLRCRHCYVSHERKDALTTDRLVRLFEELAGAGTMFLTFTGGEVALRQDLFTLVDAARTHRFAVQLMSSGTLWSEPEWDELARLGVYRVGLSLYSAQAEIHDRITGVPGSHNRALATLHGLEARGIEVVLGCPVLRTNADRIPELLDRAHAWGVSVQVDPHLSCTDQGCTGPQELAATNEQLRHLLADPRLAQPPRVIADPHESACRVGRSAVFINSAGDVLPCINWPAVAGNVCEQPFLPIYREAPLMLRCRGLRLSDMTTCAGCDLLPRCSPCPAANLRETSSPGSPSPELCRLAKARTEAAAMAEHADTDDSG